MLRDLLDAQTDSVRTATALAQKRALRLTIAQLRDVRKELVSLDLGSWGWAERQAVNSLVQGTAADLFKRAFLRVSRRLREMNLRTVPIKNIHDELAFYAWRDEFPVLLPMLRKEMEDFPQFRVPIKVDFSYSLTSWADKKELAA